MATIYTYRLRNLGKIFSFLGFFLLFFSTAHAETIKDFDVVAEVQTDNSVFVTETILYDSEGLAKHGIFRTINTTSSEGRSMNIENVQVVDERGLAYPFEVTTDTKATTLKIGDPNSTFVGTKTYIVSYRAENAVAQLSDFDELYWNATGNEWPFSIQSVTARVVLPQGASVLQSACYVGVIGSTETCSLDTARGVFISERPLADREGITIAVGFPKGVVRPYPPETFLQKYGIALVAIFATGLFILGLFARWKKYGRDPKGRGVIIPQYDVPEGLTPLEVGVMVYEKVRAKDISAEIIYLATKGYLKIDQIEKKTLGIFSSTDYTLTLLREDFGELIETDKKILEALFGHRKSGGAVSLSELENKFYKVIPSISTSVRTLVLSKQYYKNLSLNISPFSVLFFFFMIFLVMKSFSTSSGVVALITFGSFIVSVVVFVVIQRLMPSKTEKGVAIKEYILGLKEYMQVAEKDRLAFHNAPEKKPELFEQLLPYALVLGVEESWAKEFDTLYTTPPTWYQGESGKAFSALSFTHAINNFSSSAFSSFTHSPRSSGGSGGGGSSGGGGGGGGGGSW